MATAVSLGKAVGVKPACGALNIPRATFYRRKQARQDKPACAARPLPPLALSIKEREAILDVAHEERFWDSSPYQIYATLLDEGTYLCSIRTMYRILGRQGEVKERRRQVSRPNYKKPELLATAANQVWSWDISVLQQCRNQRTKDWN